MAFQRKGEARGKWIAVLYDECRKRRFRTFASKRAAEAAEAQNRRQHELVESGISSWREIRRSADASKSIDAVIAAVERDLLAIGRSEPYRREFARCARAVLSDQLDRRIVDLDATAVEEYIRRRWSTETARTRNAYRGAAKQVARYALRHQWITTDPFAGVRLEPVPIGGHRRDKRCVTPAEFFALVDEPTVRESGRRLWYMTRFLTGIRGTELARLRREDLRQLGEIPHLRVSAAAAKTGQPRLVPIVPELAQELLLTRGWLEGDQRLWSRVPTRRTLQADLARAGITEDVRPGWFRLTTDVWLDEAGVNLHDQMLLLGRTGRGSVTLTMWVYQDLEAALPRLERAVSRMWEWVQRAALRAARSAPATDAICPPAPNSHQLG